MRAADVCGHEVGNLLRILAKRTRVDDGIVGIRVHVSYGEEIPMHADGTRLLGGDAAEIFRVLQAAGCCNSHCVREGGRAIQAIADAEFKVRGNEQRELRFALQTVRQVRGFVGLILV